MSVVSFRRRLDRLGADNGDGALVYLEGSEDQPGFRPGIDEVASYKLFSKFFDAGSQALPVAEFQRRIKAMMEIVNGLSRSLFNYERRTAEGPKSAIV